MSSAAEAELAAVFNNEKEAIPSRIILEELGHQQKSTPIQTDNSTTNGIFNCTVKNKCSKSMDTQFYWLLDRQAQNQFRMYCKPGTTNYVDYYTKHHPVKEHGKKIPITLNHQSNLFHSNAGLQGCVETILLR